MTNTTAQTSAFIVLLAGPITFGILGKPTEMGLCIAAASIALAFSNIERIKRFKGAGFEAEMLEIEKKVEAIIAKEAEPEEPEAKEEPSAITGKLYGLDSETQSVVKALGNSKYTWRTTNGIARESHLSTTTVKRAINWLMMNHLIVQAGTAKGTNWGLSEEGRNLYNSIKASDGSA